MIFGGRSRLFYMLYLAIVAITVFIDWLRNVTISPIGILPLNDISM